MAPTDQTRYDPGYVLAKRFRIVRFLGRGGMGEVYEVADLHLNQHVALKLLRAESRSDPRYLSMLRDEVRKARSVSHANVCRVFDFEHDEESGVSFVVMELVRGETLHARLARGPRFDPEGALPILRQIAGGMDAIHSRQMLHLDLKPANVMLEAGDGQSPRVIVSDFGLAQSQAPQDSAESTATLLDIKGGTREYMAPERFLPGVRLTPQTDIYSFGLMAHEMVSGAVHLPPAWDRMVKRCIAPEPADRFPSCSAALDSLVEGVHRPILAARRWLMRHRRGAAIGCAAAAFAGVVAAFWPAGPAASPAALRWYSEGVDAIRDGTYYKAVRALEQAVEASPSFPLAHASLAEAWYDLDSPERAAEELLKTGGPSASRYRIDGRSRERIDATRHTVTREFSSAVIDYDRLAQSAPDADRPRAMVDLGRALERANEPRKAMEQYEAAVRLDPNYAGAWLRLALLAGRDQQAGKMTQALDRAESLYQAASNFEGVTQVFYERGTYALLHGHLSEAAQWLERAQQSAQVTGNPHQRIRILHQMSAVAYQRGETLAGQRFAEDAIREARANNIEFLAGRSFLDLGNALATGGDNAQAVQYLNEALRIGRNYHSGYLEALALANLGSIGIRTRVDEQSAQLEEQALKWFQANGYPREASLCLVHLGRYHRDRGDLAGAMEAYNKQLALARETRDDLQTALALSSVASVLIRQERFPEALKMTLDELGVLQKLGNSFLAAYAQESLAGLYAELGRFQDSETATEKVAEAGRKSNIGELLADIPVQRARALLLDGKANEAAAIAERKIPEYEAKYPTKAGDLLQILALARSTAPETVRLAWCERTWKLARGAVNVQLSLRLAEATLHLQARNAAGALELCPELRAAFERQQSEYSLYRTELIEGAADRLLGRDFSDAASRAEAARDRFQKRFESEAWATFLKRSDAAYWEKILRQLRPGKL